MELTRNPKLELVMAAGYILLSFLSFYCACYRLPVGVKYIVNLVIAAWAVAAFMINPRFVKMKFCLKYLVLYYLPFVLFWLWSLVIWIVDFQTTDYIIRGSKNIVYMLTNILYLCAAFYLFGQRSIYYTFIAMCMANLAVLVEVGLANGFGNLFSQYITLLTSFATVTGPIIRNMELHDMVFGWGPYIIYFLLHKEKHWWKQAVCLLIAVFFFTLGFKRIGVLAVIPAVLLGFVYQRLKPLNKRRLLWIFPVVFITLAFGYIVMIHTGAFYDVASRLGLNLMGREGIYEAYNNFFTLSPTFTGNGIRFIYNYGETTGGISSIHNVYLELYIELGFVMWFVWMWYDLYFRSKWTGKHYTYAAAGFLFAGCIYVFITYMTDNTYFYFPINVSYRLLAMAWCYEIACQKHLISEKREE